MINDTCKMPLTSMDIASCKREQLKSLFPEAFTEGNVDFDQLKRALGQWVEPAKERFGLGWPGKAECMKIIQQPSVATLKPARDESVNFDDTENLFIEGDNLEVLKLLQKSYFGKVKMIYIDPPYNTGNEFIYPDKFAETLDTYLEYTGQKDSEGRKFSTNSDENGRFHSRWLNMMYPRLYLAKNLLKNNGLIFISIDHNEAATLRLLLDEIFGEENFVCSIVWEKRFTRSNNAKLFATLTESVLLYRKSDEVETLKEPRSEKADSTYSNPDNDPRGIWTSVSYVNPATKSQRPNLVYKITNPITGEEVEHPTNAWKYERSVYEKHNKENRLYWGKSGENKYPRLKKFLDEMEGGMVPVDLWDRKQTGTTDEGSKELEKLLGGKYFDFPKPTALIKRALSIATKPDEQSIIMDFFAGSGVLGQAVQEMNQEDGGNRKFILVQLPEPTTPDSPAKQAGYKTIADLSKERIRRAAKKIEEEQNGQLDFDGGEKPDLGFKVFKLSRSNFKVWEGERIYHLTSSMEHLDKNVKLAEQMEMHVDHINDSSTPEDILYELLLKSGFALTVPIKKLVFDGGKLVPEHMLNAKSKMLNAKLVFSIEEGALLICLDKELNQEVIDAIADENPCQVICLDEGFKGNDQLKANAVQTFKARAQEEETEIVFRTV